MGYTAAIFPMAVTAVAIATAALGATDCIPPEEPIAADAELAAKYRPEIVEEYQRYWTEGAHYIACLDARRDEAMRALRASVDAYNALFPTNPVPSEGGQSE